MADVEVDVNRLPLDGEGGLMEVLGSITDPRKPRGIRHPFASVIALAVIGVLGGLKSYEAIAHRVRNLSKEVLRRVGCRRDRGPSESTIRRVLMQTDVAEVDRKVGEWFDGLAEKGEAIAIDGKTLKGSGNGDGKPWHLLGAITHETAVVVAQQDVDKKTNEITQAKPLLENLDLRGRTITADAMHIQVDFSRWLVEEMRAHYVFIAKENQPTLLSDIVALEWNLESPAAETIDKGHGRIEIRKICLSDDLSGYLRFPHAEVVFCLDRKILNLDGSLRHHEVVYGVTSLQGTGKRAAKALLALVRGHWTVENRLHWVRDVTYDEDRSQVRTKNGPRAMATLRNMAMSLLRLAGASYIASANRWCNWNVEGSLRLLGLA